MKPSPRTVVFQDYVGPNGEVGIQILFKDSYVIKHEERMGDCDYNPAIGAWILFGKYDPDHWKEVDG